MALTAVTTPRDAAPPRPRLRVIVAGLRGVVNVQGGIETHARMLYPLLARLDCDVEVIQRGHYYRGGRRPAVWRRLKLTYLWSPRVPGLETAVHTLLAVLYAAVRRPDVLHLHAIGPAILSPLARLLGLRVVVTLHAPDYENAKWGTWAKRILRGGERWGMRFANRAIVVSPIAKRSLESRYAIGTSLIPNGAPLVVRRHTAAVLGRFGLERGRYVLCVARLDPVKRHFDLINAFKLAHLPGWKLALVGALEAGRSYADAILARASGDSDIVLTDFQTGAALRELYSHAGVFVLPSAVEGHPIALLEALTFGIPALASAIPANQALPLPRERYFDVGDVATLARLLESDARDQGSPKSREHTDRLRKLIRERYSWRRAAQLTRSVYEQFA
jgi:glycosyltransferase involved in cell wall biosynthesis